VIRSTPEIQDFAPSPAYRAWGSRVHQSAKSDLVFLMKTDRVPSVRVADTGFCRYLHGHCFAALLPRARNVTLPIQQVTPNERNSRSLFCLACRNHPESLLDLGGTRAGC